MGSSLVYLPIFYDNEDALRLLSDADRGALLLALLDYAKNKKMPENLSAAAKMAFMLMSGAQDRYAKYYAANSENGKKGGAPKGNQNAKKTTEKQPKNKQISSENQAEFKQKTSKKQATNTNTITNTNTEQETTITKETDFDRFWSEYPRQVAKTEAKKAFGVLMKSKDSPSLEYILQSVRDHAQSNEWIKDGGQYIPHPATFIRKGMYDDRLVQPKKSSGNPFFDLVESGALDE